MHKIFPRSNFTLFLHEIVSDCRSHKKNLGIVVQFFQSQYGNASFEINTHLREIHSPDKIGANESAFCKFF